MRQKQLETMAVYVLILLCQIMILTALAIGKFLRYITSIYMSIYTTFLRLSPLSNWPFLHFELLYATDERLTNHLWAPTIH